MGLLERIIRTIADEALDRTSLPMGSSQMSGLFGDVIDNLERKLTIGGSRRSVVSSVPDKEEREAGSEHSASGTAPPEIPQEHRKADCAGSETQPVADLNEVRKNAEEQLAKVKQRSEEQTAEMRRRAEAFRGVQADDRTEQPPEPKAAISEPKAVSAKPTAPPPPPSSGYYALIEGQQYGPFNMVQLSRLVKEGLATPKTYVWREDMEQWQLAGRVAELLSLFPGYAAPQAPPVPPPSASQAGDV